jgi:hypothetical protein
MRNINIQRIGYGTIRHVELQIQDESFQNDVDGEAKVFKRFTR